MTFHPSQVTVADRTLRCIGDAIDPDIVLFSSGPMRGWVFGNAFMWETVLDDIGRIGPACAIELPGTGDSEGEGSPLDVMVDCASAYLESLPDRPRHLVGHDEGGAVALRLALERSALVASATLVAPLCLLPMGDGVTDLRTAGRLWPKYDLQGQRWMLDELSYSHHHISRGQLLEEAVSLTEAKGSEIGNPALLAALAEYRSAFYAGIREQGSKTPVLIVSGQNDTAAPPDNALELYRQMLPNFPQARFALINRSGHYCFRDQPEAFVHALRGHLGLGA